jgi:hypothetical protein
MREPKEVPMIPIPNDVKEGSPTMTKAAFQEKVTDFSLVMGGPLFQLFRRHISPEITWRSICAGVYLRSSQSRGCRC